MRARLSACKTCAASTWLKCSWNRYLKDEEQRLYSIQNLVIHYFAVRVGILFSWQKRGILGLLYVDITLVSMIFYWSSFITTFGEVAGKTLRKMFFLALWGAGQHDCARPVQYSTNTILRPHRPSVLTQRM